VSKLRKGGGKFYIMITRGEGITDSGGKFREDNRVRFIKAFLRSPRLEINIKRRGDCSQLKFLRNTRLNLNQ